MSVQAGDSVQLRLTTASVDATTRTATLSIDGLASSWSVTTGDTTPNAFSFTPATNADGHATVASDTVAITGLDTVAAVSVSGAGGPEVSIDGGA